MFERFFAIFGNKSDAPEAAASTAPIADLSDAPTGLLSGSFRPAHPVNDAMPASRVPASARDERSDLPRVPGRTAEDWAKLSNREFAPAQSKYLQDVLGRVINETPKDDDNRLHLVALKQAAGTDIGPDFIPYSRLDLTKTLATKVSIPSEDDRAGLSVALRETARRHFDSMAEYQTALSGSQVRLHEVIHISEGKQVLQALSDNDKHGIQKRPEGLRDIAAIADMASSASSPQSRAALFSQMAAAQGNNGYLVIASAVTDTNPKPIPFKPVQGEDGQPSRSTTGLFYVTAASEIVKSAAAWRQNVERAPAKAQPAER